MLKLVIPRASQQATCGMKREDTTGGQVGSNWFVDLEPEALELTQSGIGMFQMSGGLDVCFSGRAFYPACSDPGPHPQHHTCRTLSTHNKVRQPIWSTTKSPESSSTTKSSPSCFLHSSLFPLSLLTSVTFLWPQHLSTFEELSSYYVPLCF